MEAAKFTIRPECLEKLAEALKSLNEEAEASWFGQGVTYSIQISDVKEIYANLTTGKVNLGTHPEFRKREGPTDHHWDD